MENKDEMEAKFHIIPAISNNDDMKQLKNPQIMSQIKRFIFNAILLVLSTYPLFAIIHMVFWSTMYDKNFDENKIQSKNI